MPLNFGAFNPAIMERLSNGGFTGGGPVGVPPQLQEAGPAWNPPPSMASGGPTGFISPMLQQSGLETPTAPPANGAMGKLGGIVAGNPFGSPMAGGGNAFGGGGTGAIKGLIGQGLKNMVTPKNKQMPFGGPGMANGPRPNGPGKALGRARKVFGMF